MPVRIGLLWIVVLVLRAPSSSRLPAPTVDRRGVL
jgi:hypothetical protein